MKSSVDKTQTPLDKIYSYIFFKLFKVENHKFIKDKNIISKLNVDGIDYFSDDLLIININNQEHFNDLVFDKNFTLDKNLTFDNESIKTTLNELKLTFDISFKNIVILFSNGSSSIDKLKLRVYLYYTNIEISMYQFEKFLKNIITTLSETTIYEISNFNDLIIKYTLDDILNIIYDIKTSKLKSDDELLTNLYLSSFNNSNDLLIKIFESYITLSSTSSQSISLSTLNKLKTIFNLDFYYSETLKRLDLENVLFKLLSLEDLNEYSRCEKILILIINPKLMKHKFINETLENYINIKQQVCLNYINNLKLYMYIKITPQD